MRAYVHRFIAGIRWMSAVALTFSVPVYALSADTTELDDAAARLQYAFYTADARGMEDVLSLLEGIDAGSVPAMKQYYDAYGHWKLAQLYVDTQAAGRAVPRGSVGKAAEQCTQQAKAAIASDPRLAEAYAIEAICSSAGSTRIGGNCARDKSLRNALEQEPQNPRIRLIEWMCTERNERDMAVLQQKLRAIVDSFESAPPARPGKPDWGHAEALMLLGQSCLQRGDSVAARDVLEQALVLAPDYRRAQEMLQVAGVRPK